MQRGKRQAIRGRKNTAAEGGYRRAHIFFAFAHAHGMIKRIFTLTAAAVCLVAALLVIYNFSAVKQAERTAKFAGTAYECAAPTAAAYGTKGGTACYADEGAPRGSAAADGAAAACALRLQTERANPARLLACGEQAEQEHIPHENGHETPPHGEHRHGEYGRSALPHREYGHGRFFHEHGAFAHGRGNFLHGLPRLYGGHGIVLVILPFRIPCPVPPAQDGGNTPAPESGRPLPEGNGNAPSPDDDETSGASEPDLPHTPPPAVVDEADEAAAE